MTAPLTRSAIVACVLAPFVAVLPGILEAHRRIDDTVPTTPYDDSALSFSGYVFGSLLPLLLSAPFFWCLTAHMGRGLRASIRAVAIAFFVNALVLPNNPQVSVDTGYLFLLALWVVTATVGIRALSRRATRRDPARPLFAGVLVAIPVTMLGMWLDTLGWPLLGGLSALGVGSTLPWAWAASAALHVSTPDTAVGAEGFSFSDVIRRLTPDRAFSTVAVLIAAVSAWFSFQANQLQQDVRMRAHADQILLMQRPTAGATAEGDSTGDGARDLVIENYSRLPARSVILVAVVAARQEANGVDIGTINSCQQARLRREGLLATFDQRRTIENSEVQFVVWFSDASGTVWQRRPDGPPSARESPVFGVGVVDVPVEKLAIAGCVPT